MRTACRQCGRQTLVAHVITAAAAAPTGRTSPRRAASAGLTHATLRSVGRLSEERVEKSWGGGGCGGEWEGRCGLLHACLLQRRIHTHTSEPNRWSVVFVSIFNPQNISLVVTGVISSKTCCLQTCRLFLEADRFFPAIWTETVWLCKGHPLTPWRHVKGRSKSGMSWAYNVPAFSQVGHKTTKTSLFTFVFISR